MQQRDYLNMDLFSILKYAVELSGKNEDTVGALMGWKPGNYGRMFSNENYWPTLPSIPRFCSIVGNNALIDWLHAHAHAGGVQHEFPALDCQGLLADMIHLMRALGDVSTECERAVADQQIQAAEAKRLVKRLLSLCTETTHTIRGLRPIASGNGHGDK